MQTKSGLYCVRSNGLVETNVAASNKQNQLEQFILFKAPFLILSIHSRGYLNPEKLHWPEYTKSEFVFRSFCFCDEYSDKSSKASS